MTLINYQKQKRNTFLKMSVLFVGGIFLLLVVAGIFPMPEMTTSTHNERMERLQELKEEAAVLIQIENELKVEKLLHELDSLKIEIDKDLQRLDFENRNE